MPPDVVRSRKLLATFDFKTIFIEEMVCNIHNANLEIAVDGHTHLLSALAEKCGMAAFICLLGGQWPGFPAIPVRRARLSGT